MGITIVQKSNLKQPKPKAIKSLVLAGGALTGAAFKIGGLKSFNDYFTNFQITDFDIFMGISSGSLLATSLLGGLPPEEMLKSLDGSSKKFSKLQPWHFYWPNWEEYLLRPFHYVTKASTWLPRALWRLVTRIPVKGDGLQSLFIDFLKHPTLNHYERLLEMVEESALSDHPFPSLLECLPSGAFDNAPLERYLRYNIRHNKMTNNFKFATRIGGKRLYITAMTLDSAEEVIFGPDERNDVTISKAVQASTAMPGFYKPVKIGNDYFVDGGVKQTANLDLMIQKGAKLIVCYNPFRPYENKTLVEHFHSLTEEGFFSVLNQFFRTIFHSRLHAALRAYEESPTFDGDIILIEPEADDQAFFSMNPFGLGHRLHAAQLGFESVRNSIDKKFDEIAPILSSYGIEMSRKGVEVEYQRIHSKEPNPFLLKEILEGEKQVKRKLQKRA